MAQHREHLRSASEQRRRDGLLLIARGLVGRQRLSSGTQSIPDAALKSILDTSADCIKVLSFDGAVHFMNEDGCRDMEIDDFDQVKGQPWAEFWSPDQRPELQHSIDEARSGGVGRFVGHRTTAQGTRTWWERFGASPHEPA
jgi:PAS fold